MSAPRTEELRQRYDAARAVLESWVFTGAMAPLVEKLVAASDEMREALAVLEEQNTTLTRERDEARRLADSMNHGYFAYRYLEWDADGRKGPAPKEYALPWKASLGGSSLAPQKEETK